MNILLISSTSIVIWILGIYFRSASGEGDAAQRVGAEVSGRQAGAGQCLPCWGAGEKQEGACCGKKHYQHNCYFTVTVIVREKHSQI